MGLLEGASSLIRQSDFYLSHIIRQRVRVVVELHLVGFADLNATV